MTTKEMLVTLPDNFENMTVTELEVYFYSNGNTWLSLLITNAITHGYENGFEDGEIEGRYWDTDMV